MPQRPPQPSLALLVHVFVASVFKGAPHRTFAAFATAGAATTAATGPATATTATPWMPQRPPQPSLALLVHVFVASVFKGAPHRVFAALAAAAAGAAAGAAAAAAAAAAAGAAAAGTADLWRPQRPPDPPLAEQTLPFFIKAPHTAVAALATAEVAWACDDEAATATTAAGGAGAM